MLGRTVLPLLLHILLTLLVAIWFGIWLLGPALLIFMGGDDPRDVFGNPLSLVGSGVLALGWLYFVVRFFMYGDLPD